MVSDVSNYMYTNYTHHHGSQGILNYALDLFFEWGKIHHVADIGQVEVDFRFVEEEAAKGSTNWYSAHQILHLDPQFGVEADVF